MRDKEECGLLFVERMDVEIFKAEVDGIHKKVRFCLPENEIIRFIHSIKNKLASS